MLLCCDSCASKLAQGIIDCVAKEGKKAVSFLPLSGNPSDGAMCEREAAKLLANGKRGDLLGALQANALNHGAGADLLVIRPIEASPMMRMAYALNIELAKTLDACVVPAVCAKDKTDAQVIDDMELVIREFAREGLDIRTVASGCSENVVREMAGKGVHVIVPSDPAIRYDAIMPSSHVVTPTKFLKTLHDKARADKKTIVLPEGSLDRILLAAARLKAQNLVNLVLIGSPEEIKANAAALNVSLDEIEIVDPKTDANFEDYANTLYELRKAKGMTEEKARQLMADKTFFGTMMVYKGRADGMVSGATTSTADTIRPALQFIKTKPGIKTVSGVFLMSLADRVYLYGDCAVIPNPTTDQLRDVAVASAETAKAFGLDPKVAMLSYSTGTSGAGPDVDAVREATQKVREAAPDLAVEGPIQYDAAVDPTVAKTKLPNSPVAGKANVFVFPTLNAGNIGYKAVQRASGALAIGPLLQGLNKPVNDLSRGATVDDIVNTVIVTAIQAQ